MKYFIIRNLIIFILLASGLVLSKNYFYGDDDSSLLKHGNTISDIDTNSTIVLIIPPKYTGDMKKHFNHNLIKTILFNSFYNFFSIVPALYVPEKEVLENLALETDLSGLAVKYNASFIVYGSFDLKGKTADPEADIRLKIWSRISGSIISNDFTTQTDMELFDAIDSMNGYITRTVLNEEMKLSYINFGNFKIGREYEYELLINNRQLAAASNNNFSLNLKLLSGKSYRVQLRRRIDQFSVISETVQLLPGASTNFSYTFKKFPLCDFEDGLNKINDNSYKSIHSLYSLSTYADPESIMKIELSTNEVKQGHYSLLLHGYEKAFAGCVLDMTGFYPGNLNGKSTLRMWVYGKMEFKNFNVLLTDKYNEQFICQVTGSWTGWKQIHLPFEKFKKRVNFQLPGAVWNGRIDYPLKLIDIFDEDVGLGGYQGVFDIYLDDIDVIQ